MTIKEASVLWPIIKAYSEGETIEIYDTDLKSWHTVINPKFTPGTRYRVKTSPTRKQLAEFSKWANDTLQQEMARRGWNLEGYFAFFPYDLDDKSSLDLNK